MINLIEKLSDECDPEFTKATFSVVELRILQLLACLQSFAPTDDDTKMDGSPNDRMYLSDFMARVRNTIWPGMLHSSNIPRHEQQMLLRYLDHLRRAGAVVNGYDLYYPSPEYFHIRPWLLKPVVLSIPSDTADLSSEACSIISWIVPITNIISPRDMENADGTHTASLTLHVDAFALSTYTMSMRRRVAVIAKHLPGASLTIPTSFDA